MSFSAFANHVRNPALPHQRRVSALRSCVQLYGPIGFEATLSFLQEQAGPFHKDQQALQRALDHLTASRALWHDHLHRYAAERRIAKQRGHRTPRSGDENPNMGPRIWYGAPRPAALHALHYWQRHRLPAVLAWHDPGAHEIAATTSTCLTSHGPMSTEQHRQLNNATQQLRDRIDAGLYSEDVPAYFRARALLRVAALIETADRHIQTGRNGSR